jgi:putative copper export protein
VLAADLVVLGLRALAIVAIFAAVGSALFLWLFAKSLSVSLPPIRTLARVATLVALLSAVLHYVLLPARMAGSFSATFDASLEPLLAQSNVGTAHVVRAIGLGLMLLSLDEDTRLKVAGGALGAVLTLGSFALTGHTTLHEWRLVLVPLLLVHLGIAAFWFGGLWPLQLVAAREPIATAGAVVARFSRIAIRCVPLVFVCGAALAVFFVHSFTELATGYGAMILGKTSAFAALMGLAALNNRRYGPALAAGQIEARAAFERVVLIEWAVIATVLVATALMTELFAPENLHATFGPTHDAMPR